MTLNKYNNIEWLRLIFALQVMFFHLAEPESLFWRVLRPFPGVPAFFFISGFLIYASYMKNKTAGHYFLNRFLRVFPALFVVALAGVGLVVYAKGASFAFENLKLISVWFLAQITLGQAFNPGVFRDIGVGVINGPLWTITVEVLFYMAVPMIVGMEKYFRFTVPLLFVLSFLLYSFGAQVFGFPVAMGKTAFEFLQLTPLVWGWMFLAGVMAFKHYDLYGGLIKYFILAVVPLALLIGFDGSGLLFSARDNTLGLFYFLSYVALVLYFAFGMKYVPLKFDLSYGVYIWHMIVINFLLVEKALSPGLVTVSVFVLAALSWFLIEKPALNLKKYSLRKTV